MDTAVQVQWNKYGHASTMDPDMNGYGHQWIRPCKYNGMNMTYDFSMRCCKQVNLYIKGLSARTAGFKRTGIPQPQNPKPKNTSRRGPPSSNALGIPNP